LQFDLTAFSGGEEDIGSGFPPDLQDTISDLLDKLTAPPSEGVFFN
jgi:hypothetical protein